MIDSAWKNDRVIEEHQLQTNTRGHGKAQVVKRVEGVLVLVLVLVVFRRHAAVAGSKGERQNRPRLQRIKDRLQLRRAKGWINRQCQK